MNNPPPPVPPVVTSASKMTPEQSWSILDIATQPKNSGMMGREDYINIHIALGVYRDLIKARQAPVEDKSTPETKKSDA